MRHSSSRFLTGIFGAVSFKVVRSMSATVFEFNVCLSKLAKFPTKQKYHGKFSSVLNKGEIGKRRVPRDVLASVQFEHGAKNPKQKVSDRATRGSFPKLAQSRN